MLPIAFSSTSTNENKPDLYAIKCFEGCVNSFPFYCGWNMATAGTLLKSGLCVTSSFIQLKFSTTLLKVLSAMNEGMEGEPPR